LTDVEHGAMLRLERFLDGTEQAEHASAGSAGLRPIRRRAVAAHRRRRLLSAMPTWLATETNIGRIRCAT